MILGGSSIHWMANPFCTQDTFKTSRKILLLKDKLIRYWILSWLWFSYKGITKCIGNLQVVINQELPERYLQGIFVRFCVLQKFSNPSYRKSVSSSKVRTLQSWVILPATFSNKHLPNIEYNNNTPQLGEVLFFTDPDIFQLVRLESDT